MQTRSRSSALNSLSTSEGHLHTSESNSNAHWSIAGEALFIQVLLENKGVGLKQPVLRVACLVLNCVREKGGKKTVELCRNKLSNVCISFIRVLPVS